MLIGGMVKALRDLFCESRKGPEERNNHPTGKDSYVSRSQRDGFYLDCALWLSVSKWVLPSRFGNQTPGAPHPSNS